MATTARPSTPSIPSPFPSTHRALHVTSYDTPPAVTSLPLPTPSPGTALVRILATQIISYSRSVYSSTGRAYPFPLPLTAGYSGIGRIAACPGDSVALQRGQLVHVDCVVRARDDPSAIFLAGVHQGHSQRSAQLMEANWRDGCAAEFAAFPIENLMPLDEKRLLGKVEEGGLGYDLPRLSYISTLLVPYGGLADVGVRPGETVVVAPATGGFGGAAVKVALAMGARVVAMGRNERELERMEGVFGRERVRGVRITGDVKGDAEMLKGVWGEPDVFFDISPPAASHSSHFKSALLSLRHAGRASLMGGQREDVQVPLRLVMVKDIMLKGKWMYERPAVAQLVKMVEAGVLGLGEKDGVDVKGTFTLEEWDKAFTVAEETNRPGSVTVITP
ncbi:NAD(P)-binding protein [Viridothelium virens]|uniref:NAD(P)-binding protein n=1 Tax=Viridothelium virens TaxID=1048519 RepID=A0A6A6HG50_VIRVR|nr:NAD(P)-binding protein [Viridothelium virens]